MRHALVPPLWLRLAANCLLIAWSGLGLLHTGYVMVRPHGLIVRRPPELAPIIGLPGGEDSRIVAGGLDLLASAMVPPEGPVLVVRPADAAQSSWDYVHFQLAHLSYPRRVDLVATGSPPPLALESYHAVLAPPGVPIGAGWRPQLARLDLILYRPTGP